MNLMPAEGLAIRERVRAYLVRTKAEGEGRAAIEELLRGDLAVVKAAYPDARPVLGGFELVYEAGVGWLTLTGYKIYTRVGDRREEIHYTVHLSRAAGAWEVLEIGSSVHRPKEPD
jgi:hypothetical protein